MQADWNQTNVDADDYIKNKPSIGVYTAGNGIDITNNRISVSTPLLNQISETAANLGHPATYDSTASYSVGDVCEYQGYCYKCNTAIVGGEVWDTDHWDATGAWEQVDTLNQNLTECVKNKTTADITISTATGRTLAQALNLLVKSSNFDISKVSPFSYIKIGIGFYRVSSLSANRVVFTYEAVGASTPTILSLYVQVANNFAYSYNGTTVTAVGGETLSAALEFYY